MKKIEQIYREILHNAIEKKNFRLTQLGLSEKLGLSLSTINLAVKKLEKMNSVKVEKMSFKIIDVKKILYYWASFRNLEKDIIYKTKVNMPVRDIEKLMPDVIYGGYSAYKFKFKNVEADYSEVYVYADEKELEIIKRRFPLNNKNPNLFVLKKDENMDKMTIGHIFADLWNLRQWYAADFLKAMEEAF